MSSKQRRKRRVSQTNRPSSDLREHSSPKMSVAQELLLALIGLLLTIGGTFVGAFVTNMPWQWAEEGVKVHSLGVTFQIGAVMLAGCLGGKNAGALSQIAYLFLGLTGLPVFTQGGGLEYLLEPSFGYLIGFIPGAWLCGFFAFQTRSKLESLAFSCLCSLATIHISGITYLVARQIIGPVNDGLALLFQDILKYSIQPLPGQLAIVCAVTVIAFTLRQLMFY